jgi:hypothetical protein
MVVVVDVHVVGSSSRARDVLQASTNKKPNERARPTRNNNNKSDTKKIT